MKTIHVAAALIREGEKVLAVQRGTGRQQGGWEFPGGKLEAGETAEQALCREIREELGAEIRVGRLLTTLEFDYPEFHLRMACFWAELAQGGITLKEHRAARYLSARELESVEWLPADQTILPLVRRALLDAEFQRAKEELRPGRYRHFKGREYELLCLARHSETEEPMVVYRQLYGERGVWVRPACMWNESVTRDGKTQPRFTLLNEGDA